MEDKRINELEDMIYSWYWARNGPSPALAVALMMRFVNKAKRRACVEGGAALKRGQYRFVATALQKEMHITPQSYRTICTALSNHNLTTFQHQTNKKATIATICNFNDYVPLRKQSNNKPTTKQHESNNKPTNYKGTHDNIIINNNDKNKKYYLDSQGSTGARARGGVRSSGGNAGIPGIQSGGQPPVVAEIAEIASDREWIEVLAAKYGLKAADITPWFGAFRTECLASGKKEHDSLSDCKSHFNNWLRLQLKARKDKPDGEDEVFDIRAHVTESTPEEREHWRKIYANYRKNNKNS